MRSESAGTSDSKLTIFQYWHESEVPAEVTATTSTFRDVNPDLEHRLFDRTEAEQFIGEHFSARELTAFRSCAVPAMQSDYFRYCAVLALGGIYSDISIRCLRPLRGLIEATKGNALFKRDESGTLINGFFLFEKPGHPLLNLVLGIATANIERRAGERVHKVTGPWIFNGLLELHQPGSLPKPPPGASDETIEMLLQSFHSVADRAGDVASVLADVRIESLAAMDRWIERPEISFAHKHGARDWIRWHHRGETIYKTP